MQTPEWRGYSIHSRAYTDEECDASDEERETTLFSAPAAMSRIRTSWSPAHEKRTLFDDGENLTEKMFARWPVCMLMSHCVSWVSHAGQRMTYVAASPKPKGEVWASPCRYAG